LLTPPTHHRLHTSHTSTNQQVLPGGRIPADGALVVGCSYINEAMITGESQPVLKQQGDPLIGGTINTGG
jgi:P-type E1-E2 ATPase